MEKIYRQSVNRVNKAPKVFVRYLFENMDWRDQLICISGLRGTGKTTMMLQHLNATLPKDNSVLYVSLDDIYFTENKLTDLTEDFFNRGGKYLFVDEVHKYKNWSIEIKNIYDNYPEVNVVITGSSMLELEQGKADLSRRMSKYHLNEMSFREYIEYEHGIKFEPLSLKQILSKHTELATDISNKVKPLAIWEDYLTYGCLPFYKDSRAKYHERLKSVINTVLESDIAATETIDYSHLRKLKQLLYIISQSVPFKPNMVKLSERIGIDRKTLMKYLVLLDMAGIIILLGDRQKGVGGLTKPEKIYLANSNLVYALADESVEIGNIRETFFLNQIRVGHDVAFSGSGDFLVDGKYTIEIGGKNKGQEQIRTVTNSFLVLDNIALGTGNRIPLWLFGFMY